MLTSSRRAILELRVVDLQGIEGGRPDRAPARIHEEMERGEGAVDRPRHAFILQHPVEPGPKLGAEGRRFLASIRIPHDFERGRAGGGGDGVRVEGAGVEDLLAAACLGLVEVQVVEYLLAPGHGAARQAARDDLGVGAHIGCHAETPLGAAGGDAEAGNHLVEDQRHAVLRRQLPQEAEKLERMGHEPERAAGRLQDRGGDVVVGLERGACRLFVARRQQDHLGCEVGQHAGRRRTVEVRDVAGGHVVMPAVEVALETHDLVLAGVGAGEAERHVRRLGAGGGEAHALRARHHFAHDLRPAHLALVVGAGMRAVRQRLLDRRQHFRSAVAEQQGAVAAGVIDVLVAVPVPLARALGPHDVDSVGLHVARIVNDARGQDVPGLGRERRRAWRLRQVGLNDAGVGGEQVRARWRCRL